MVVAAAGRAGVTSLDEERIREVYGFTARTLETAHPVPFGALIVNTRSGRRLMQATNAVARENDPSSHAEVRTVRLACKKLKRPSLAGYTMYSTCEPCPMCMANALVGQAGPGGFWGDHRGRQPLLSSDSHCGQASRAPRGYGLHSRGPGAARAVLHAFHSSQHAEGFP